MTPRGIRTVCVLGLGYIGLPTAAILAEKGYEVAGVDVNVEIVNALQKGEVLIVEPELKEIVQSAHATGHLRASLTPERADVFIIAVPTPFANGHKPDLSYVFEAARMLAPFLRTGNLVVLESTSPVETTEKIREILSTARPDLYFASRSDIETNGERTEPVFLAHCPERVLPGKILTELVENDRIVGGINGASTKIAAAFYRGFVRGAVLETDSRTAEMSKLTENAFRDVNIAFANELSLLCEQLGVNVWELISLANRHPRVKILQPSTGVGGHCIAVDPWFIVHAAPETAKLIRAAREVNDSKPVFVAEKILEKAKECKNPVIACLGLAFKPDVGDLRESPAIKVVQHLKAAYADNKILVVEPNVGKLPESLSGVTLCTLEEALDRADIIAVIVAHKEFRSIHTQIRNGKILLDFVMPKAF